MLEFARKLCQGITGTQCSVPALSSWSLVAPAQANIGADMLDIATAGLAAGIPANAKLYGSYFETGLAHRNSKAHGPIRVGGYGGGVGAGIGWTVPFVGAKVTGKLPNGLKKKILESLGGAGQGRGIDVIKDAVMASEAGGTRLVTGPDASGGDLTTSDFQNAFCTVFSLGANFSLNGVTAGLVIFSKQRPVIDKNDLIYARGLGFMGGAGLAAGIDVEASGIFYRVSIL